MIQGVGIQSRDRACEAARPGAIACPLPVTSGVRLAPQQTPRSVTPAPPSDVTVPPLWAIVCVIELTSAVVTVGDLLSGAVVSSPPAAGKREKGRCH